MELLEIIYVKDGTVCFEVFSDKKKAEMKLSSMPSSAIRIDLHGVLDTLDVSVKIPNAVVISYVGDQMRQHARAEIRSRVEAEQVAWGVLVFKRGKGPNANKFIAAGSKAWVCWCVPYDKKAIFLDDSEDHVKSVNFLNLKKHHAVLVNKNTLIGELEAFL